MNADQSRDEKMIHFLFQLHSVSDQKFHRKTTIFKIDDLLLLSYAVRNHHFPTQPFKEGVPEGKVTIKHQGSGNA
jgi:hypothetical protein